MNNTKTKIHKTSKEMVIQHKKQVQKMSYKSN